MRRAWQGLAAAVAAVVNWRFFKLAVLLGVVTPGAWLAYQLVQLLLGNQPDVLGVDPTKTLLHRTGQDALAILFVTLSVTPIRRLLHVNGIQRVRRMLGVSAFFYALAHVSVYLVFDQLCYSWSTCDVQATWQDILKRRFIFAGMTAFTILLMLAVTSTSGWVRRLKKNWVRLHRLVYVAAIAGVVHFTWIQKSDIREPLRWAYALLVLLGLRVVFAWQRRQVRARPPRVREAANS